MIVIYDSQPQDKTLKNLGKVKFVNSHLNKKTASLAKNAEVISVFVCSEINKEILDLLPKLKMIATRSTGFDHVDLEECKKRNITVCNIPSYGEHTIAEYAFFLLLCLTRKIIQSNKQVRNLNFSQDGLEGTDLKNKTIGIIGTGNIGKHTVKIASGFSMNLLGYDINKKEELIKLGLKYCSLDELFKKSDIITFHVPLNKYTKGMLNLKNISKLKKGMIVINTSRGQVIETKALIKGLESGKIGALGSDVLENESFIGEKRLTKKEKEEFKEELSLLNYKNVIITPHIAFDTKEAKQRIVDTTFDNIKSYLNGKIKNKV